MYKKLASLSEISKEQLSRILNYNSSPKDLVLESNIIKPLEKICGIKWLRANNVEKIYKLEEVIPNSQHALVYMIYTKFKTFRIVVDQIQSKVDYENLPKDKYHIVLIPKLLYPFKEILEELGLYNVIKLYSFQWYPIYLDTGILSVEIPHIYRNIYVDHDLSFTSVYARSLWQLEFVMGKPKFYLALGQHSNSVLTQLEMLNSNSADSDKLHSDFGAVVLLDRSIDYPSALLAPVTYAAVLHEIYKISCGVLEGEAQTEEFDTKCNPVAKRELLELSLDSSKDSIYDDIKYRYFTEVPVVLSNFIKNLKSESESSKEMALDKIKKYVATQLQASTSKKKSIAKHLSVVQTMLNVLGDHFEDRKQVETFILSNKNKSGNISYLEEILATENNEILTLRLFCVIALTQKLNDSEIKTFWNKFLHQFGYKYGYVLTNLIKSGFINEYSQSLSIKTPKLLNNDFYTNANKLRQIPIDASKVSLKAPTCCSYVFRGNYIPLVSVVTSMLLSNTPLKEIKRKLEVLGPLKIENKRAYPLQPRVIFLYVIGGLTYAEIAALNLLESLTDGKIIVCSDRIVSGNDLMKAVMNLN